MKWLEISYHTTHEKYEIVSQVFIDSGSKGVLLEDSNTLNEITEDRFGEVYRLNPNDYPESGIIVKGYLSQTKNIEDQLNELKKRLFEIDEFSFASLKINMLDEQDWAESWKAHYEPIFISENFVIKPSWMQSNENKNIIEVLLDPGMAFGSGTHETTRMCLSLLEFYVTNESQVVDVGTGSGILAIAADKLGAKNVYGVDLDEMAVVRARENGVLNSSKAIIESNNLMNGVTALNWSPNLVVANILAPIIINMLTDVFNVLHDNDIFICSGIILEEADSVRHALKNNHFEIVETREENGWIAIVSRKKTTFYNDCRLK